MIDIVIEGFLGRNCEIRKSPRNGKEYMNFSVATSERQGKDTYETFWFTVFCPNPTYFNLKDYLLKGRCVRVYGVLAKEEIYNHPTKGPQIDRIIRADRIDFARGDKKDENNGTNNTASNETGGVSETSIKVAQGVVMSSQMTPAEQTVCATVPPERVVSNPAPQPVTQQTTSTPVSPIAGSVQDTDAEDDLPF